MRNITHHGKTEEQGETQERCETSVTQIGVDIGRHQLLVSQRSDDVRTLVPLLEDSESTVLRWLDDGPRRFSDRVRAAAGIDDRGKSAAADVGAVVAGAVPIVGRTRVAVPPSFGPQCRADVAAGLRAGGLSNLDTGDLVDRPIASLASWVKQQHSQASHPSGPL